MKRLQEMKELLSRCYVLLRGDEYHKSLLTELETSVSLIEKEHGNIEFKDHKIFEDIFAKTFKNMQDTSDKVYHLMSFISLLQIKYSNSKNKNIVNINNSIKKFYDNNLKEV